MRMALRVVGEVARELQARERGRVGALRLGAGERGALHLVEFLRRERRLAQHFGDQAQRRLQVLAPHLERRAFAVHRDRGVQLVEGILDLGAALLLRAPHQHAAGEVARHLAAEETFLVAPVQRERRHHAPAARLLRQERGAHVVRQALSHHARLDVLRRGIESLAQAHAGAVGLVGIERRLPVARGRDVGAIGCFGGDEGAHHPVRGLEVALRDALHVGGRDLLQALAVQEEQPPVAHRGELRQRAHVRSGLELGLLEIVQERDARALDFLVAHRIALQAFHCRVQRFARCIELAVLRQRGSEVHEPGVVQAALGAPDIARDALSAPARGAGGRKARRRAPWSSRRRPGNRHDGRRAPGRARTRSGFRRPCAT